MASVSGRRFSQGIEGRLTSDRSQAFVRTILAHTPEHRLLLHAGARSHTSQAPTPCVAQHAERITVHPLPSYAPDSHPMAYLWKKTKKRATHHQYGKECARLTVSVDKALAYCATHPETV